MTCFEVRICRISSHVSHVVISLLTGTAEGDKVTLTFLVSVPGTGRRHVFTGVQLINEMEHFCSDGKLWEWKTTTDGGSTRRFNRK